MKSPRIFALLAAIFVLAPAAFAADFGLRAGRYDEAGQEFVGAELLFDVGSFNVNPNVEYLLEDDVTAGTVNIDLTLDVANLSRLTPYVGAGVGIAYAEAGDAGAQTDVVGNLIGGVAFHVASLQPYAQVKYFRVFDNEDEGDDDEIAFTVGLRF